LSRLRGHIGALQGGRAAWLEGWGVITLRPCRRQQCQ
jgi:hypothetical protein